MEAETLQSVCRTRRRRFASWATQNSFGTSDQPNQNNRIALYNREKPFADFDNNNPRLDWQKIDFHECEIIEYN